MWFGPAPSDVCLGTILVSKFDKCSENRAVWLKAGVKVSAESGRFSSVRRLNRNRAAGSAQSTSPSPLQSHQLYSSQVRLLAKS